MPVIQLDTHPNSHPFAGLDSLQSFTPANLYNYFQSPAVNDFHFVIGETPLSTWMTPFTVIPIYLFLIKLTQWIVAKRGKPFKLKAVFFLHNTFLSLGSLLLLLPLAYDVFTLMAKNGFWNVFCDMNDQFWHGRIYYVYYWNYIFKFIELLDTLLLAAKGKPLIFLHVYHHAATLLLCFTQLRAQSCMQFVPIGINLAIHVLMYSYYAASTVGIRVWWKQYLTMAQIIQFVFGLAACVAGLGSLSLHVHGYGPEMGGYPCHGEFSAAYFGVGILASYLLLFIKFFFDSYGKPKALKTKKVE